MHTIQDLKLCNIKIVQPTIRFNFKYNIITYLKHKTQFQIVKIKLSLYI
jgi:hypothetical protein